MGRERQAGRPRKRFGQHFLVDAAVVKRIVELVRPDGTCRVLEIGPGRGALTRPLVAALEYLVAVEIDRDLVALLHQQFDGEKLAVVEGDILRLDLTELLRQEEKEKWWVVGNLPYNISAPLLFLLLEQKAIIHTALLMLQREVAQRLLARPGTKNYGILSVLLGQQVEARHCFDVSNKAFRPVPQVQSTVVELQFRQTFKYPVQDERIFKRLVRTVFGQRRKMLRNSLRALTGPGGQEELGPIAERSGIDLKRRPETLTLEEFSRLSDAFSQGPEVRPDIARLAAD